MKKVVDAYKTHRPGSRKGQVHEKFDKDGAEAALKFGESLGLKPSTVKAWMGYWKSPKGTKAPVKATEPAKSVATKTPPKKKPDLKVVGGNQKPARKRAAAMKKEGRALRS